MTDTDPARATLRVRDPGDLIEAIPYLLGFHPRDSLVLVGLDGSRIGVTARVDLAELHDPAVLAGALRVMAGGGATGAIAVIYADTVPDLAHGELPWHALVGDLAGDAEAAGLQLADALLVRQGTWWSYLCADHACCPPEGRELPGDSSPAAAAATYAGLVALPDRSDLAAALQPKDDATRALLEPALAEQENLAVSAVLGGHEQRRRRSVKRAIFAAARDADSSLFLGGSGSVGDDDVCRYAVALTETQLRDAVWLAVDQGRLDGRPLWRELARRLPAPYDAAPLFLFGWACWRAGNGPSAALAAERALASDPGYTAADLLLGALAQGLDPRHTPRLRMPRSA